MMKRILAGAIVLVSPVVAFAQSYAPNQGIGGIFTFAGAILNRVVPFLIALAVVWFIWNVFQYTVAGDEDKKKTATTHIVWGIVGLFIMISVWGLVAILQSTFGTSGVQENIGTQIPTI